jgi:hypothetical protein
MAKNIIIGSLAEMINEGFKTTATKEDINRVEVRLDRVESRLGRIETLLIEEQNRKIENLEARMKNLEDALPALSADRQAAGRNDAVTLMWRLSPARIPSPRSFRNNHGSSFS